MSRAATLEKLRAEAAELRAKTKAIEQQIAALEAEERAWGSSREFVGMPYIGIRMEPWQVTMARAHDRIRQIRPADFEARLAAAREAQAAERHQRLIEFMRDVLRPRGWTGSKRRDRGQR